MRFQRRHERGAEAMLAERGPATLVYDLLDGKRPVTFQRMDRFLNPWRYADPNPFPRFHLLGRRKR